MTKQSLLQLAVAIYMYIMYCNQGCICWRVEGGNFMKKTDDPLKKSMKLCKGGQLALL